MWVEYCFFILEHDDLKHNYVCEYFFVEQYLDKTTKCFGNTYLLFCKKAYIPFILFFLI